MPAFKLKLPSTFVLALIEEMLTPLNSLYFSTQLSLKILAKQSKSAKKCLHLTVELFNLAKARDFPESAFVFQ